MMGLKKKNWIEEAAELFVQQGEEDKEEGPTPNGILRYHKKKKKK